MQVLQRIILPPQYRNEALNARAKFLHIALWLTFLAAIYFAAINSGATRVAFCTLAVSSLIGIILNYLQKYILSASIPVVIGAIALFYNFYDGMSLFDPGIVALPLLIILSSFLFGSRFIYRVAFMIILGIASMVYLERAEIISPANTTSNQRFIIISILVIFTAVLQRGVIQNWEHALDISQQSEHKIHDAYARTLEGWAKTLEFYDRETLGHTQRVTTLCNHLAQKMGILEPEELEHIRWGTLLHDIGKLAIPPEILRKASDLSKEEWDLIKCHPTIAGEFLANIDYLQPALLIVRSHHENWDGTGYPEKLEGEQIPLHARIFSIVDNWDALTTDRPYRKAWSHQKTIDYMREQSGKKFDPRIVDVFITEVVKAD
jgi:putative nucleotidyltransferase with HDIG domain